MKKSTFFRFVRDTDAQDAVEYALLVGFLCVTSAAIVTTLATDLGTLWTNLNTLLSNPG